MRNCDRQAANVKSDVLSEAKWNFAGAIRTTPRVAMVSVDDYLFFNFFKNNSVLVCSPIKRTMTSLLEDHYGPCVVSLEESPSSSPSRPAKLCISFVGVK